MFSQDEDGEQRIALFVVFGVAMLVVVAVLAFGVNRLASGDPAAVAVAGAPAAAPVALAAPMPKPLPTGTATAQAASDAASVSVEQGVVKFYFASGKADLAPGAGQALADVVKGAQSGRKVVVSGYHDASGNPAQNAELAKRRALAVRQALLAAGTAESRIELKKPEPVATSGSDAEARRVEIRLQ